MQADENQKLFNIKIRRLAWILAGLNATRLKIWKLLLSGIIFGRLLFYKIRLEVDLVSGNWSKIHETHQFCIKQKKSQLEWSAAIQAGSCRTVDVIHHKVYFLFSKRVKRSSFWEDITYKLMILFQASFLPGGHGVAVKDLCKDILPVRHLK